MELLELLGRGGGSGPQPNLLPAAPADISPRGACCLLSFTLGNLLPSLSAPASHFQLPEIDFLPNPAFFSALSCPAALHAGPGSQCVPLTPPAKLREAQCLSLSPPLDDPWPSSYQGPRWTQFSLSFHLTLQPNQALHALSFPILYPHPSLCLECPIAAMFRFGLQCCSLPGVFPSLVGSNVVFGI